MLLSMSIEYAVADELYRKGGPMLGIGERDVRGEVEYVRVVEEK